MQTNILERLFVSFTDLETAIKGARATLASKSSVSPEILERLDSYDDILSKQKNLAIQLCRYISNEEWDEVSRHVSLINGLSSLIRDDARAILSSLSLNIDKNVGHEEEINFC
jgi:hypothetical protein